MYPAIYLNPSPLDQSFSQYGYRNPEGWSSNTARQEAIVWQEWQDTISYWENLPAAGFGGWTLDVNHFYDPVKQVVFYGDGGRSRRGLSGAGGIVITTMAGSETAGYSGDGGPAAQAKLSGPIGIAAGPDGSIYIAEAGNSCIRRVSPDGIITTVAGNGTAGYSGDGGPAAQAQLDYPNDVAISPDGSLYISDSRNYRIRRVSSDGIITTVTGNGAAGYSGDGGPATQAQLIGPTGVAVGPDGSLYIAECQYTSEGSMYGSWVNNRIRRVGTDGIITTVAGVGPGGYGGDGGPAAQALLNRPEGVAVGADGTIYIAEMENQRIRRVGTDGIITTVAGIPWNRIGNYSGDGGPATLATFHSVADVEVGPDRSLYITDWGTHSIRRVGPDGIISTVAGINLTGMVYYGDYSGDNGPATQAQLNKPDGVAVGPDGFLYIADTGNSRVRQVGYLMTGVHNTDIVVPAEDGSKFFVFDSAGRHRSTLNALTGSEIYTFNYDSTGLLSQIKDASGNVTRIERDEQGKPTAIIAPGGQRTGLAVDEKGYLSKIICPLLKEKLLTYYEGGLLKSFSDHKGNQSIFTYDELGRLTKDAGPAGGYTELSREELPNGHEVSVRTAEGSVSKYRMEYLGTGGVRRVNTDPLGGVMLTEFLPDSTPVVTYPDGTVMTSVQGPDPRPGIGMGAPLVKEFTIETPMGQKSTVTQERTVEMQDQYNLFSLTKITDQFVVNGEVYTTVSDIDLDSKIVTVTSTSPQGRKTVSTLDPQGRLTRESTPGLGATEYSYNEKGYLASVNYLTDSLESRLWQYTYDDEGNLASLTDPFNQVYTYQYNGAGLLIKEIRTGGREIDYSYDANGNLTSITPPDKSTHNFVYNSVNLKESYTPPDTGDISNSSYTYNLDKQLSAASFGGENLALTYTGSELGSVSGPHGITSYSYDVEGRLSTIMAGDVVQQYTYNGGLVTGETVTGSVPGSISWIFNNNLLVSSLGVNGTPIAYKYDKDGLLTNVGALTVTLDMQNATITGTNLGQVTTTQSYNGFGELQSVSAQNDNGLLYNVSYTRDKLGRITQKNETVTGSVYSQEYSYDDYGNLKEVKNNGITEISVTYDANGNRTNYTDSLGTVDATYDAQDRLIQYGNATYTYKGDGSLLSKSAADQTTQYNYDVFGNLRSVVLPDGKVIEYIIDGENRRVGKKVDGNLEQGFLYQNDLNPAAELDGGGNVTSRFIYGTKSNVPDYLLKGGKAYRIIADHLGSPRLVVDVLSGEVVQRMDYDIFGNVTGDSNPGFQPFGFAGGLYDRATGLTRFGARDYDAGTGRWTSKEAMGIDKGDLNLYSYSRNNPLNLVDTNGLECADAGKIVEVNALNGKMFEERELLSGVVQTLDRGAKVEVVGCDRYWSKVKTSEGEEGWMRSTYLKPSTKMDLSKLKDKPSDWEYIPPREYADAARG